jgi:hypothetical protein
VHHHVQAGRVRAGDPGVQRRGLVDQEPPAFGHVGERLVERRRMRAEGSIHEALEPADAQPLVAAAVVGDDLGQALPAVEGHGRVDAGAQAAGLVGARERAQVLPGPHAVHGRDALPGDVAHGRVEGAVRNGGRRFGDDPVDQCHGIVLQHAGRLAVGITDDLPAIDLGCARP